MPLNLATVATLDIVHGVRRSAKAKLRYVEVFSDGYPYRIDGMEAAFEMSCRLLELDDALSAALHSRLAQEDEQLKRDRARTESATSGYIPPR